jgi:Helicase HerA, central domain
MTRPTFVQVADTVNSDPTLIPLVSFEDVAADVNSYVVVNSPDGGRRWLAQIATFNLNLNRTGAAPTDATALEMHEQMMAGRARRDCFIQEVKYYSATLICGIVDGKATSVRTRPSAGSTAQLATFVEVIPLLGIPPQEGDNRLGHLVAAPEIGICYSPHHLRNHTLVAGSTGRGKSNTIGRLAFYAQSIGRFVILFDHKPDYQDADRPNDEITDGSGCRLPSVLYYGLQGTGAPYRADERRIVVPCSGLNMDLLSAVLFSRPDEQVQADAFMLFASTFLADRQVERNLQDGESMPPWVMQDLVDYINNLLSNKQMESRLRGIFGGDPPKRTTIGAMFRKIRARKPSWVDGTAPPSARSQPVSLGRTQAEQPGWLNVADLMQSGHVSVIRIDPSVAAGHSYALFVQYVLDRIWALHQALRERERVPGFTIIDEAQDIFCAPRAIADRANFALAQHIRRARTANHGYLISVQSANTVPIEIVQNLNSKFIFRHKAPKLAREVMTGATDTQINLLATFAPGECFVDLDLCRSWFHAQMDRSPFMLTKE